MADLNVSGAPRATAPLQAPRANPNPVQIKIKPGETLSQLAKRYGVEVDDFQRPNGKKIENKNLIYAGETLVLPAKVEAPKKAEPAKVAKTAPLQTDTLAVTAKTDAEAPSSVAALRAKAEERLKAQAQPDAPLSNTRAAIGEARKTIDTAETTVSAGKQLSNEQKTLVTAIRDNNLFSANLHKRAQRLLDGKTVETTRVSRQSFPEATERTKTKEARQTVADVEKDALAGKVISSEQKTKLTSIRDDSSINENLRARAQDLLDGEVEKK
ncbi:MAG TPA: hypothetical protein DD435_02670 [Cyanobacteria bacterium UBA8530]|nr:hypothetical protein [Cyanobacteria bacterium UBA8530]